MQFRHGKHLHVNFYHFIMENLFAMKDMKGKFTPVFHHFSFIFHAEATVVRGIEFWREF
jgi:hypothetical protein